MAQKEDPIAKIERERAEKANRKTNPVMLGVCVALALALAFVAFHDYSLVSDLKQDKADLTAEIVDLQNQYNDLSSDYDSINAQLDSSREEVAQLIENIKATEAANRKKMRQYEKELKTLRTIMRGYIVQIDSLNAQNKRLTEDLASSRSALAKSESKNKALDQKVKDLNSKVAIGSVVKARNFDVIPENSSSKRTDRSSRVVDFLVNMTLSENELAPKGPMTVYLRVKDADGVLVVDGTGASFDFLGEKLSASACRTIDYEGRDVEIGIYLNPTVPFTKGIYTVEAYLPSQLLGGMEVLLR